MLKNTAWHISSLFLNNWVILYRIPEYVFMDNGTRRISILFDLFCTARGNNPLTMTVYHPKWSRQIQRLNKTIISRLQHDKPKHQRDWYIYVRLLTYVNAQEHISTTLSPLGLVLLRHCPGPAPSTILHPYRLTQQRQYISTKSKRYYYPALQQCPRTWTSKWNRQSDDIRTIMTGKFAMHHCSLPWDTISTLIVHQWLCFSQSVWWLSCTAGWCLLRHDDSKRSKYGWRPSRSMKTEFGTTSHSTEVHWYNRRNSQTTNLIQVRRASGPTKRQSLRRRNTNYCRKILWQVSPILSLSHCASCLRAQYQWIRHPIVRVHTSCQ